MVNSLVQGTDEWHEFRKAGVGASEVAAILGVCPYSTPYQVWLVKTGRSKGFEGNSFTMHGQETEAKARSRYELINMDDMPPACATHPIYPVCRASLDGLSADGKLILEIKCPMGMSVFEAAQKGVVADNYWPQVQFQLAVTGADLLHFFVYHSQTQAHALVEVRPDISFHGQIMARVLDFWARYVLTNTPPPLTDRDVKVVDDNKDLITVCRIIEKNKDSLTKAQLDKLKAAVIESGGHPKIRCGRVQVSTVLRNGKFSYHKLTIIKETVEAV